MILMSDPIFGEVELTGAATELARLAGTVAEGEGFISAVSATALDSETLAGVEVRQAPGPGVLIHLDSQRRILVISGDPVARALFAANLDAMTTAAPQWLPWTAAATATSTAFPGIPNSLRDLCPWSSASRWRSADSMSRTAIKGRRRSASG
ncbi:hypothetical protein [Streptomyces sp. NPDC050485]|uniref:hypothetical protein n=1 Tax=Streptomyces sp. NPDC050485 TaxID=3365617 RepID=UPI0037B30A7E